jgi:hypothetical protein
MNRRRLALGASIVLVTLLGYFEFPGHTYLQSDTQVYVPMMERLRDPSLFTRDIMVLRTHLTYTAYDETTLALVRISGMRLETVLVAEQLVFRALGVTGLLLIALRLGLDPVAAWFVAAVASLGATIGGPAVLTVEYEPVPRGFAISLIVLAIGLVAEERYAAGGIAAATAFLYHPPTAVPFWILAAILVMRRQAAWLLVVPLAASIAVLACVAHVQRSGVEAVPLLARLDAFQESLQRMRAGYSYVSSWGAWRMADYGCQALVVVFAWRRLRAPRGGPLAGFLCGLPAAGLLSIPLSWTLLEWQHFALAPEWQPARAVLFVTLMAAILAAAAGVGAAIEQRRIEAAFWLSVAFFLPVKHASLGAKFRPAPLALACGLGLLAVAGCWFLRAKQGWMLVPAALLAFFAMPILVQNYSNIETRELTELAGWARTATDRDAVFLFPDARTELDPGVFRARALRALYVDWKSGGQVNYFPQFSRQWWTRWVETGSGRWNVTGRDFPRLGALGVDYVVLRSAHAITGESPAFSNSRYVAYRISSR